MAYPHPGRGFGRGPGMGMREREHDGQGWGYEQRPPQAFGGPGRGYGMAQREFQGRGGPGGRGGRDNKFAGRGQAPQAPKPKPPGYAKVPRPTAHIGAN
eukprot:1169954-Pyramimonas_sp.AAC.1